MKWKLVSLVYIKCFVHDAGFRNRSRAILGLWCLGICIRWAILCLLPYVNYLRSIFNGKNLTQWLYICLTYNKTENSNILPQTIYPQHWFFYSRSVMSSLCFVCAFNVYFLLLHLTVKPLRLACFCVFSWHFVVYCFDSLALSIRTVKILLNCWKIPRRTPYVSSFYFGAIYQCNIYNDFMVYILWYI